MDPEVPSSDGGAGITASASGSGSSGSAWRLSRALAAEEAHCRRALAAAGVASLREELLREMRDMWLGEGQDPPPERFGPYVYSAVSGADGGLEAYVRRKVLAPPSAGGRGGGGGGPSAAAAAMPPLGPPETLLDRASVAADAAMAASLTGLQLGDSIGCLKLCPAHRLLAYTLPVEGQPDTYCALVRDTAAGRLVLPGGVVGGLAGPTGLELAADGRSLLVLRPDEAGRPAQVVLHDLSCAAPPLPLLAEPDPRFFLGLGRSKDGQLLLINSNSKTCSEVHILDAASPRDPAALRLVQPRTPGLEYYVEHHAPRAPQPPPPSHQRTQPLPQPLAQRTQASRGGAGPASASDGSGGGTGGGGGGRLVILTNADLSARGRLASSEGGGGDGSPGCQLFGRELQVVAAPLEAPGLQHWAPLLPAERPGVVVTDMDMFRDHVVLYERREGLPGVSVLRLSDPAAGGPGGGAEPGPGAAPVHTPVQVPLPPWVLHLLPGINADPASPTLRLTASGPLHPPATFDVDLASGAVTQLGQQTVPRGAADLAARCSLLRLTVPSPAAPSPPRDGDSGGDGGGGDGGGGSVDVPVTLVLPPGVTFPSPGTSGAGGAVAGVRARVIQAGDASPAGAAGRTGVPGATWHGVPGPRPVLVSVYGAYGMPLECEYDAAALALLARGWALARVHVRGGGELGRGWHAGGAVRRKRAGAADAEAAARALVGGGLTAPGLLAGHAISAGGVVLAGALASSPALWGAAVLRCPFLELLGPATAPAGQPLVAHEWDEWGRPTDPRDVAAMAAACPYEALGRGAAAGEGGEGRGLAAEWRAAVLASCAEEDPRVHPGIPAKWVARLRRRLQEQYGAKNGARAESGSDASEDGPSGVDGDAARASEDVPGGGGGGGWRRLLRRVLPPPKRAKSGGDGGGWVPPPGAPPAPLLRVHRDGTGHVRLGGAAAAEAAEEAAFLLLSLPPPPFGATAA